MGAWLAGTGAAHRRWCARGGHSSRRCSHGRARADQPSCASLPGHLVGCNLLFVSSFRFSLSSVAIALSVRQPTHPKERGASWAVEVSPLLSAAWRVIGQLILRFVNCRKAWHRDPASHPLLSPDLEVPASSTSSIQGNIQSNEGHPLSCYWTHSLVTLLLSASQIATIFHFFSHGWLPPGD